MRIRTTPRRTIPHRTGFGPDEWFYSVVVVPVGELSWWGIVLGIVVQVGNGWALFLSGGELSSWGVVLEPEGYHMQPITGCTCLLWVACGNLPVSATRDPVTAA